MDRLIARKILASLEFEDMREGRGVMTGESGGSIIYNHVILYCLLAYNSRWEGYLILGVIEYLFI
jgi:hypothetical protein